MQPDAGGQPEILDITAHVQAMPEGKSFLEARQGIIEPVYSGKAEKIILLMEWPLAMNGGQHWLRCYAAILPHGKLHVAEAFFTRVENTGDPAGEFLGSARTFSLRYPGGVYASEFDDFVADRISRQLGFGGSHA